MQKFIKNNYKIFLIALIYGLFTYNLYFSAHYVHDSYRIYNFGFNQNLTGFWTQGRPLCMLFYMLLDFLKISPRVGQIISIFLTILFLSLAITITYSLIVEKTNLNKKNDTKLKLIILIITNCLFFNVFITDWMMFFESCIFALGTLLSIIAVFFISSYNTFLKKYVLSSIMLVIGIFCYQATIALGGTIIVLFTILENKDKKILLIIKNVILNMIPYVISLLLNFLFVKIINLNNSSDVRLSGNVDILYNISFAIKQIKWYFFDMFNYPTKHIVALLIISVFIFFTFKEFKQKRNKLQLLFIVVSIISLWILSILPIIAMPSNSIYFISRNIPFIASIFPFMLLAFYVFDNNLFLKDKKIYYTLSIIYFFIVTISIIKVTSECLKNNIQDINIAKTIQLKIDEYENSTNNEIKYIVLLPDSNLSLSEPNINYYSDNTVRAFSAYFGAKEVMYFANNRKYIVSEGDSKKKMEIFGAKEWNEFSIEQLKFDKNILYLVKY